MTLVRPMARAPLAGNLVTHDTGLRDRMATARNAEAAARFIATPGPAEAAGAERSLIVAARQRGHLILTFLDRSAR